ncbi:rhodanese-like domain-containing protein [Desulfobotulus sp. H1]|uniref:Rhodanese-like domain-containing protein n=1 Tax=Desulfobotulus pelophilus TaxID=2823377 RepID=A0ABT3NC49_9BACT|nr:rhodanese-like domain-containing protein [Desulfobotulus pelophilus]MCW7755034.1 rhodanese-like domain-containing protein [Desulfobotulus pelophilus]
MHPVAIAKNCLWQMPLILIVSILLGLGSNAIRQNGLPLSLSPHEVREASGEIIPPDEALVLFQKKNTLFVDARSQMEYNKGRIQGAVFLPHDDFDAFIPHFFERVPPEQPLVVYCDGAVCDLSHVVAERLRELGYENVRVLINGWGLWQQKQLPTEKGD